MLRRKGINNKYTKKAILQNSQTKQTKCVKQNIAYLSTERYNIRNRYLRGIQYGLFEKNS